MPSREFTVRFVEEAFGEAVDPAGMAWSERARLRTASLAEDAPDYVWHAAMLKDVLARTSATPTDLRILGYSHFTVKLVQALTKEQGVGFLDHIKMIAGSDDEWLLRVKLADIEIEADPARIALLPMKQRGIGGRYARAKRELRRALRSLAPDAEV